MATDAGGGDFWKLLIGAIPGVGALGWAIFRQLDEKGKSNITITHERDDEAAAARARANLDDAQKEWFDTLRSDCKDLRAENDNLRKDRDRGWDLARAWRERCRDERHALNNCLQQTGGTPPAPLPGLEEIEGKRP